MIIIAAICILVFAVLYIKGREIDFPGKRKGIFGIFDTAAAQSLLIIETLKSRFLKKWREKTVKSSEDEISEKLSALNPGVNKEEAYYGYVIRKLSLSIMVFLAGTIVASLTGIASMTEGSGYREIKRDPAGGESKQLSFYAGTDEGDFLIDLTVFPREMSEKEIDELAGRAFEKIEKLIQGNNPALDHVTEDLNLKVFEEIKPFRIEWLSSDPDLISPVDGKVCEVKKDTAITLTAIISYSGHRYEKNYDINLTRKNLSPEEKIADELTEGLKSAEREKAEDEVFVLPEKIGDRNVTWSRRKDYTGFYLLVASIGIALLIYRMSDKDLKDKLEVRKRLLKKAYPEILQMLALYTGAGMTVRNAFIKIASSGQKSVNPVYDEMLLTCREMKSGKSEEEAYSEFGNRCGLQEYIKVSAYLGQSLKRGGTDLKERLREEILGAQTERIQNCRKLTEEASTKLLLPMVMMLVVVMVMILLPAFSNMDI